MKKNGLAKVFAIFALAGIIISIVGTGILVIMSSTQAPQTYTPEELSEMIRISTGEVSTGILDNSNELIGTGEVAAGVLGAPVEVLTSTGESE